MRSTRPNIHMKKTNTFKLEQLRATETYLDLLASVYINNKITLPNHTLVNSSAKKKKTISLFIFVM